MKNSFLLFITLALTLISFTSCSTDDALSEDQIERIVNDAISNQNTPETETIIQVTETELGNIIVQTPENHTLFPGDFLSIKVDVLGYSGHSIDEIEAELRLDTNGEITDFIDLESVSVISERLNMGLDVNTGRRVIYLDTEPINRDHVLDGQLYSFVLLFQLKETIPAQANIRLDLDFEMTKPASGSGISTEVEYSLGDDVSVRSEYILMPNSTTEPNQTQEENTGTRGMTQEQINELLAQIAEMQRNS